MRIIRVLCAASMLVLLSCGSAMAAYNSSQDITLSVNLLPGTLTTSGTTGSTTFATQEAAHDTLTSSTGQEVDHFYVWLYVNGQPVAAVDPFCTYDYRR